MQITVHEFTLTTSYTAHVKVTSDTEAINNLPESALKALAEAEALDLTGFEWIASGTTPLPEAPAHTHGVYLNKA